MSWEALTVDCDKEAPKNFGKVAIEKLMRLAMGETTFVKAITLCDVAVSGPITGIFSIFSMNCLVRST